MVEVTEAQFWLPNEDECRNSSSFVGKVGPIISDLPSMPSFVFAEREKCGKNQSVLVICSFEQNFKRRNEGKQRWIGLGGRKAEDDNERTGYWFPFRIGRNDIGREEDVDELLKKW